MSIEVPHKLSSRDIQQLVVHIFSPYLKGTNTATIHPYFAGDTYARVPFAYAQKCGQKVPVKGYARASYNFIGKLRAEQIPIIEQAFRLLADTHHLLLATHVGFGKTIMAIYILSQLVHPITKTQFKACIVTGNKKVLCPQWAESLQTFLHAPRVCILGANDRVDYEAYDIFIINALNVPKMCDRLDSIGVLIVDEIHLVLSQKMCQSLLYFTPRYFIGLSATPYRTDGSDKLFELFLGKSIIFKPLLRAHTVYKVQTSFTPNMKSNVRGKLDWDKVLSAQAEDIDRNQLIVRLVQQFKYKFIVLCKRIIQIQILDLKF